MSLVKKEVYMNTDSEINTVGDTAHNVDLTDWTIESEQDTAYIDLDNDVLLHLTKDILKAAK
jgi:hypothetical protein